MTHRRNHTNSQLPICSDKYEVVRFLGSGSYCTAYLVRHKSLEQERVLKIYPKDRFPTASVIIEAQLLKSFHHPCIPTIYDLEQDTHAYYLYEEYTGGEALDSFLLHQPIISREFYLDLCIRLCSIFIYLHEQLPVPMLYRDLKPEHIILSGPKLWLIDFGISTPADLPGNNRNHLGNLTFSAPENFTEPSISFSSDIYSIGKIMEYLLAHLEGRPGRPLRAIIHKATARDPASRFETVEELSRALNKLTEKNSSAYPCTNIAVTGSHRGCGTTHLAFSLVSTLNYLGIPAVYYEKNESDCLRNAAGSGFFFQEIEGCWYYHFFKGLPKYGPGIRLSDPDCRIHVFDYGSDFTAQDLMSCDLVILITTGGIWQQIPLQIKKELIEGARVSQLYVANHCNTRQGIGLARLLGRQVYLYPPDPDPFRISRKKVKFFRRLLGL